MDNIGIEGMNRVSPQLIKAKLCSITVFWVAVTVALTIAAALWTPWIYLAAGASLVATIWFTWLIPFQVKWMRWYEGEDELYVSTGRIFHTFTVVPYGRIQYVDVETGPINRHFGIRTLTVNTASSTTSCVIKGLPNAEADALRDRLAAQARERMIGL